MVVAAVGPLESELRGLRNPPNDSSNLTAAAFGALSAPACGAPCIVRDFFSDGGDRENLGDLWRIGPGRFWRRSSRGVFSTAPAVAGTRDPPPRSSLWWVAEKARVSLRFARDF